MNNLHLLEKGQSICTEKNIIAIMSESTKRIRRSRFLTLIYKSRFDHIENNYIPHDIDKKSTF